MDVQDKDKLRGVSMWITPVSRNIERLNSRLRLRGRHLDQFFSCIALVGVQVTPCQTNARNPLHDFLLDVFCSLKCRSFAPSAPFSLWTTRARRIQTTVSTAGLLSNITHTKWVSTQAGFVPQKNVIMSLTTNDSIERFQALLSHARNIYTYRKQKIFGRPITYTRFLSKIMFGWKLLLESYTAVNTRTITAFGASTRSTICW